jgi:gluconokinase
MPILALDVGSSSVRALLYENLPEGVQRIPDALAQKKHEFGSISDVKGAVEGNHYILELLEQCIDEVLQHPTAQKIEAVGIATFAGNFTFIEETILRYKGKKWASGYSQIFTYADTRSAENVRQLEKLIDAEAAHQRTGAKLHTAYYPAQIHWHLPLHHVNLIQDLATTLYNIWFGNVEKEWIHTPMSYSMASWSGMLNREKLEWDEEWLKVLGLSASLFPPLADFTQAQMGLNETYAKRWPALANVPFYLAVGDGAAAQVGSDAIEAGTATLTIGTTAAIRKVSTDALPPVPAGCWSYRIDKEHHLLGGALSEGGNIFAWAKETFQLDTLDIETELSQREPDSHGLTVLPLLNGERSPNWRGDATGTIHGLRLSTKPIDMVQALLEAVALRLAYIAKQLDLEEGTRIMAAGGALHASPAWAQIIANALGRDIYVLDEAEITALGVAQLVHSALKGQKITGAAPEIAQIYKPDTNCFLRYNEAQARQNALYERLYSS